MENRKDKQIRELKEENQRFRLLLMLGALFMLLLLFFIAVGGFKVNNLEQQLSECQDKVPVWTLKIECEFHNVSFSIKTETNFSTYDEYILGLEKFNLNKGYWEKIDLKTCEVIE
jgi:hypothetical protein